MPIYWDPIKREYVNTDDSEGPPNTPNFNQLQPQAAGPMGPPRAPMPSLMSQRDPLSSIYQMQPGLPPTPQGATIQDKLSNLLYRNALESSLSNAANVRGNLTEASMETDPGRVLQFAVNTGDEGLANRAAQKIKENETRMIEERQLARENAITGRANEQQQGLNTRAELADKRSRAHDMVMKGVPYDVAIKAVEGMDKGDATMLAPLKEFQTKQEAKRLMENYLKPQVYDSTEKDALGNLKQVKKSYVLTPEQAANATRTVMGSDFASVDKQYQDLAAKYDAKASPAPATIEKADTPETKLAKANAIITKARSGQALSAEEKNHLKEILAELQRQYIDQGNQNNPAPQIGRGGGLL